MFNTKFLKKSAVSAVLALSFATGPVSAAPSKGEFLTKEIRDEVLALDIAYIIAKKCRKIVFSDHQKQKFFEGVYEKFVDESRRRRAVLDAIDAIDKKEHEKKIVGFFEKAGVDPQVRNSFCTPGFSEIQKSSLIGKYLRGRK
ncbi:hypothetical protein NBRC116601_05750 [Cognatishimia sp. WU-CL00825]|uniref:DUF5333 family protein n=1 Tax=Cognatishimia sp. WU-CL00825 TaxID=3127658 RepID=UPI00310C671E